MIEAEPKNGWTPATLRVYIERILHENNLRRDEERKADNQRVDDLLGAICKKFQTSVDGVATALELRSKAVDRRLEPLDRVPATYVSTVAYDRDQIEFQKLKETVNSSIAERSGGVKNLSFLVSLASIAALIVSLGVAMLTYLKLGGPS